jgi:N-(2-amino-2-carboxyethyl)-L-glutamate synthase
MTVREASCQADFLLDDRLLASIGNTPIGVVALLIDGRWRTAHLKLESANPFGSIKDRTALALVTDLENRGLLTPESVLIESTSGNLGVALAGIAAARHYPFVAVVDPKVTAENLARMRGLGAAVEMVRDADRNGCYLAGRLRRVRDLCARSPRFVWTNQYSNPANPRAHYTGTGPEIDRQVDADIDAIFIAVSTGGTLAGLGRYFRQARPATRVVAVDAQGSVIFGGAAHHRRLTGIGSDCRSHFVKKSLYDEHMLVGDEMAFALCRMLARETGIKVGGSSGAVLGACARYLRSHPAARTVVCVCPDDGDHYATTIFDDGWLIGQQLNPAGGSGLPVTHIRRTWTDAVDAPAAAVDAPAVTWGA